ncbi:MAG: phosphoribosylglycinamide formyltransferase [Gemmatimonadota bacterium]
MSDSLEIAVLASGSGTNLQALFDRLHEREDIPVQVCTVIGSRPGIGALDRAARHGVSADVMPGGEEGEDWLLRRLASAGADLVVLAGWLKLIPAAVVKAYRGRIINIHPALLPAFGGPGMYGHRVHEAVVASGGRVSGATVHFVDEIYDHGAIIAQWPVPVHESDDADALAARVLSVEHRLLPDVVLAYARGHFHLGESGRTVWTNAWFSSNEFSMAGIRDPQNS